MTKKTLANKILKKVKMDFEVSGVTAYTYELIDRYNNLCDTTPSLHNRLRLVVKDR